jgi:hypothetical protein
MKNVCNKESCWLKQKFTAGKVDDLKESFAPESPEEWKSNPNEWLSSMDINKVMKQYEKAYKCFEFIGPSPIDYDTKKMYGENFANPEEVEDNLAKIKFLLLSFTGNLQSYISYDQLVIALGFETKQLDKDETGLNRLQKTNPNIDSTIFDLTVKRAYQKTETQSQNQNSPENQNQSQNSQNQTAEKTRAKMQGYVTLLLSVINQIGYLVGNGKTHISRELFGLELAKNFVGNHAHQIKANILSSEDGLNALKKLREDLQSIEKIEGIIETDAPILQLFENYQKLFSQIKAEFFAHLVAATQTGEAMKVSQQGNFSPVCVAVYGSGEKLGIFGLLQNLGANLPQIANLAKSKFAQASSCKEKFFSGKTHKFESELEKIAFANTLLMGLDGFYDESKSGKLAKELTI